jgi:hypothetical protein
MALTFRVAAQATDAGQDLHQKKAEKGLENSGERGEFQSPIG